MIHAQNTMTPAQSAALIDAAFQSRHPLAYFDTSMATFRMIGRDTDASTIALVGFLYAEEEIELLMALRAAWKQGLPRSAENVLG